MKRFACMIVIVCGLVFSGCATTMTKAPKKEHWNKIEYSECTQSPAPAIVDTVVGGALVGSGVYGYTNAPEGTFNARGNQVTVPAFKTGVQGVSIGSIVTGVLFLGSATYGYVMSTRCARLRQEKLK